MQTGRQGNSIVSMPHSKLVLKEDFSNSVTVQGAMDIKYLATRYNKGRTAVSSFMEKKHQYQSFAITTSAGQAHLLAWQAESGHSGVSSLFFGCNWLELTC